MENNSFEYTYSAQRKQEVEEIRKAYLPKEEDKMEKLRKLHSIPTQKAQTASIAVGVIGTLILGTGMSLCMTDIGAVLGKFCLAFGILVGLAGMAMVAAAYPTYHRVLRKEKERIAPQILQMAEELLK